MAKKVNNQVKNGNYHSYYKFREDEVRSQSLENGLLSLWTKVQKEFTDDESVTMHMLDIGCNEGYFTNEVHRILQKVTRRTCRTIGIDIDDVLCDRARINYAAIEFITGDVLEIAKSRGTKDVIEEHMQKLDIIKFDVVCCFSVLMYIHLNGGDEGLRAVLDYLCSKGKLLILELQSWKKYRDQARRLKRDGDESYPLFDGLEWKGGEGKLEGFIKNYIKEKGFDLLLESSEKNKFDRQLLYFKAR
ncbi:probable RNA methyltransferase CG11342 [Anopheles ziemanni]|uniref:probable RNA methyltransferase CG11342 n=1 Tax=Anopheles coustani TaxID=139045 RepID=UPI00265899EC|nr:probable RNA methyltransferase CG11342 [Anopheles coustani]XP_058168404.1 probable RNA methyltransferase CG11342 [Anopheles ziemanni]